MIMHRGILTEGWFPEVWPSATTTDLAVMTDGAFGSFDVGQAWQAVYRVIGLKRYTGGPYKTLVLQRYTKPIEPYRNG